MKTFLDILNNPTVITFIVGIITGVLGWLYSLIYKLIKRVDKSGNILKAYQELFGRLEATFGSDIKKAQSLKELKEIIECYKSKLDTHQVENKTKIEVKQETKSAL